jgi:hypothetical protein
MVPGVADLLPLPDRIAEDREIARAGFDSIHLEDGMSREEATLIARVYFYNYISLCGEPYDPREQGAGWAFRLAVGAGAGYAGELDIEA